VSKKYISLREIGRQLGVPPSTIIYYKDKFDRFIPSEGSAGRRRKYPAEAIEIFRKIRQMFNDNWSTEQVEQELALKFSLLMDKEMLTQQSSQFSFGGISTDFSQEISGVLAKISDVLENETLFRSEIKVLKDKVETLQSEIRSSEARYKDKIVFLEHEIADLKKLTSSSKQAGGIDFPSLDFLSSPLVICSDGEYLGVQGKGRSHFSLKDFVHLIERKESDIMKVSTSWKRKSRHWVLVVHTQDLEKKREQDIILVAKRTITPSQNIVTEINRLNIDGTDAPDILLLTLFRQLRSVFNG